MWKLSDVYTVQYTRLNIPKQIGNRKRQATSKYMACNNPDSSLCFWTRVGSISGSNRMRPLSSTRTWSYQINEILYQLTKYKCITWTTSTIIVLLKPILHFRKLDYVLFWTRSIGNSDGPSLWEKEFKERGQKDY